MKRSNGTRRLDNKTSNNAGKETKKTKQLREKKDKTQTKIIIENEKILSSYKLLSLDLDKNISEILKIASQGEYNQISKKYDEQDFFAIFDKIEDQKKEAKSYEHYEKFRNMSIQTIQSIWKSIYQFRELKDALGQIETLEDKVDILDDTEKLKEYIESLAKKIKPIIPEQTVTMPMAQIKEPYFTYIQIFGVPDKGQFDIVLLKYLNGVLDDMGKEETMKFLNENKEAILEKLKNAGPEGFY